MKIENKLLSIGIILFLFLISMNSVLAQESDEPICAVYITGIGCPNCAFTDPALLSEYTTTYPDLIIFEYEIYGLRSSNQGTANQYFESYIPTTRAGVPFIIFNKNQLGLGRFQVLDSNEIIEDLDSNDFPMPDGTSVSFENLDLTNLPGKIKIWTKDRVLISEVGGNNELLKEILTTENLSAFLEDYDFEKIEPEPILISGGKIEFSNAVKVDDWVLEWNKESQGNNNNGGVNPVTQPFWKSWPCTLILVILTIILFFIYKFKNVKKCTCICLTEKKKNYLIIGGSLLFLIGFFIFAKSVSPESLERLGYSLPLPLFTFFIALIDGFNPCNLFVLTVLLGLLVSASHSRKRIYAIGYTFIFVVFVIYFLFMAVWLNIFKYFGFITPLRIGIALIALTAGLINCKELIAFRKGVTLMIQEQHKNPLLKRLKRMREIIVNGSMLTLILASISLAAFASLVELPCTAGFPIIYTGILTGKMLANSFFYYLYLFFYGLIYIIPLLVIITLFGFTFKGKQISKRQMQAIKFIGGLIMILLGLILLINPNLIGIGFG